MWDLLRYQLELMREEPIERLLRPGIKVVVIVGALSVAAHEVSKRSFDRTELARLASKKQLVKEPTRTGSIRR
jgi:hypothetical protein